LKEGLEVEDLKEGLEEVMEEDLEDDEYHFKSAYSLNSQDQSIQSKYLFPNFFSTINLINICFDF
jgi:hypothetical protein